MIFTELVDLVLLNVNGGAFSSEASVHREDVEAYVPAAAHWALYEHFNRLRQDSRAEKSSTGASAAVLDGSYYSTFLLTPQTDAARLASYVTLPGVVQSIPGLLAMESVYPSKNVANQYTIVSGPSAALNMAPSVISCWHEIHLDVSKVYFDAVLPTDCDLVVRACMEVSSMLGDTPIEIPRSWEKRIVDTCLDHFRPKQPSDGKLDNHDINSVIQ